MLPKGGEVRCGGCGAVILRTTKEMHDGDPLVGSSFTHPDGRPCQDWEPMVCPACKRPFRSILSDGVTR